MDPRAIMIAECVKAVDPEVVLLSAPEPESKNGERDYYYNLKKSSGDIVGSVYTCRNNIIVHGSVWDTPTTQQVHWDMELSTSDEQAQMILSSKPPVPRCVVELEDPESAPRLIQALTEILK